VLRRVWNCLRSRRGRRRWEGRREWESKHDAIVTDFWVFRALRELLNSVSEHNTQTSYLHAFFSLAHGRHPKPYFS
jgi:hypothetical protein